MNDAAYFCGHHGGWGDLATRGSSVGQREYESGEKKDICCGKTFLPVSNSLALMKSWDREREREREREEARRKEGRKG